MKAVFLDRNTFSIALPQPPGLSAWQCYDHTPSDDTVIAQRIADADIVLTNKVPLRAAALAGAPRLKLVQVTATGTDHVDIAQCQQQGIAVRNVAGYSTASVVEHTFMFMLAALRGLLPYHQAVSSGRWQEDGRFCLNDLPIIDLNGKTLTIIGGGTIGRQVASVARAFGMRVCLAERRSAPPRSADYTAFDEALRIADVISLHCPLTPETRELINADTLQLCERAPLLLNLGRGAVVNGAAVVEALNAGRLGGYATDVFVPEPPAADEALLQLKQHPRVLFTPHNAWASVDSQHRLWEILCGQVADFVGTQP